MTIFEELDRELLPGFERLMLPGLSGDMLTLVGGSGPPLLLLHGDPQTHLCWHSIAPKLAEHYTVVLADLRGRGESHKPERTSDHRHYSKRLMATEQVRIMERLGFDVFRVVGHDRGARVARRMALDYPDKVERLAVMDIVPVLDFYERATSAVAQDYFYFFFLTQPFPVPDRLIAGDPRAFMGDILTSLTKPGFNYHQGALEAYLAASTTEESISSICECFRAGISSDVEDDKASRSAGRRITCPTLVFWGELGVVGRHFDMQRIWSDWAASVSFAPMPCGHFIPEEEPELTATHLIRFLQ
jgi:haloacetate dehalogenase